MRGIGSTKWGAVLVGATAAAWWTVAPHAVLAVQTGFSTTVTQAQMSSSDPQVLIGNIIKGALGFVGVVFLILTIYAGFMWMTASGNEERIGKAKKILTGAVIGMVLIFGAYYVTSFIMSTLPMQQGTDAIQLQCTKQYPNAPPDCPSGQQFSYRVCRCVGIGTDQNAPPAP